MEGPEIQERVGEQVRRWQELHYRSRRQVELTPGAIELLTNLSVDRKPAFDQDADRPEPFSTRERWHMDQDLPVAVGRRGARGLLRVLAGIMLFGSLAGVAAADSGADLTTFCLGAVPADPVQAKLYAAQCPAYLQSLFTQAAATAQSGAVTTQLAQQQTQLAIDTAVAGLVKPPAPQVASGTDVSALAIAAQTKDAEISFAIASAIGAQLKVKVPAREKVLLVASAAERAALFNVPTDAETVTRTLTESAAALDGIKCPEAPPPRHGPEAAAARMVDSILAGEAALSVVAAATNMFQPTLLATGKAAGVTDPQQLMIAGLYKGLGDRAGALSLHAPPLTSTNPVLVALTTFRKAVVRADVTLSKCPKADTFAANNQLVIDAKATLQSLLQSTGGNPSLVDYAARKAALTSYGIAYTLLLQRDVSGGGAAAIKPNWFKATRLQMATADVVTYELVGLDGTMREAHVFKGHWIDECGLEKWTDAFKGCTAAGKAGFGIEELP